MAESTCGCQPGDVSTESVSKTVENQIASLDPQRAEALSGLQTVRAARATGYAREQKRLARKYGADSPRVSALADKVRFNNGLRRDLDFEVARAKTETPVADNNGYVFHGFVRDRQGKGLPRLTVALYDANGNWIRALGQGCSDERGYFILRFDGAEARTPTDSTERAPTFNLAAADTAAATQNRISARIYVLDAKGTALHIEKEPLQPQLGNVDFRIIILGNEDAPCPTPPETQPSGQPPTTSTPPATHPGGSPPTVSTPPFTHLAGSPPATSTPLEKIRGIGPVHARQLRAAGIADVESLLRTDTAKLVEIAGFDGDAVKREAAQTLRKKRAQK